MFGFALEVVRQMHWNLENSDTFWSHDQAVPYVFFYHVPRVKSELFALFLCLVSFVSAARQYSWYGSTKISLPF